MSATGTPHPFAVEAPDAENVWVSTGLDRQVTPEGAISASDRHVWLIVTDTDVTACSTPAFREWLDSAFKEGVPAPQASLWVLPASRPTVAGMVRVVVEHEPVGPPDHYVRVQRPGYTKVTLVPFARYPRLDGAAAE